MMSRCGGGGSFSCGLISEMHYYQSRIVQDIGQVCSVMACDGAWQHGLGLLETMGERLCRTREIDLWVNVDSDVRDGTVIDWTAQLGQFIRTITLVLQHILEVLK